MAELVLRLRALPPPTPSGSVPPRHVVDLGAGLRSGPTLTTLACWASVVASAHDGCLVLDAEGRLVSVSLTAGELLGCGTEGVAGRPLLALLDLLDFDTGEPCPEYAERVAPLAVLKDGAGLVRSLLRARHPDGTIHTLDVAAAPLHDGSGELVGSVALVLALGR